MIDCKITENYLVERGRMHKSCPTSCSDCPLGIAGAERNLGCIDFERQFTQETIAIVQKWSDEHPQKTMLMDLLEKYPNAPLDAKETPAVCPWRLGLEKHKPCEGMMCVDCWNRPLEEE